MRTAYKTEDKRCIQLFDNKGRYEFNIYNFLFDPTLVFACNLFENMGSAAELRVFCREEGVGIHSLKGLF